MKVKRHLHVEEVDRIVGLTSRELADRCPDQRKVFPTSPCTNLGCEWRIKQPEYMNCMFVASEAGDHTLEAIGEMMELTREGVRLIERRALIKVRHSNQLQGYGTSVHQPSLVTGPNLDASINEGSESSDESHDISGFDCRELA